MTSSVQENFCKSNHQCTTLIIYQLIPSKLEIRMKFPPRYIRDDQSVDICSKRREKEKKIDIGSCKLQETFEGINVAMGTRFIVRIIYFNLSISDVTRYVFYIHASWYDSRWIIDLTGSSKSNNIILCVCEQKYICFIILESRK